ncbi:MAG: response regulator [Candidatus Latescibacterota bacterium]
MPSQILIVDDDMAIRSALARWANKQGWTPFEAGHAKEALEILAVHKIDIALVDVRLPETDGLELAKRIFQLDADIPILLITAFADLDTARQALNIGVYEYFTKPFDFKDLHAGIDRALHYRQLTQENRQHQSRLEQEVIKRTHELTQINAQLQLEMEERKNMERQLVQFERLGALAEMSQGVSHNLNNILTGILGPAQLIELKCQDDEILHEARVIRDAALRAADLVKRLAVSVRGENGELQAIDVTSTIQEVIQATRPRWKDESEAKGIHIEIKTHLQQTPHIFGTEAGLYNILLNLILNAIDAMPNGGNLTLATTTKDNTIQITVSDTGIGMSEETKRRVFEPFFTTKAEVGKGLGMSGVYTAITRWGGQIDLDSTPNIGTTATIHLPILTQLNLEADAPLPPSTRPGHILIVEDEDIVRTFLTRALSPQHDVDAVSDGIQGLEQFAKKTYDVVLVDLGMPNLPGHQVIEGMKKISPQIATILITGWQLSEEDPRYQAFDFHLQKPFESIPQIITTVAKAIQTYDQRQKNPS